MARSRESLGKKGVGGSRGGGILELRLAKGARESGARDCDIALAEVPHQLQGDVVARTLEVVDADLVLTGGEVDRAFNSAGRVNAVIIDDFVAVDIEVGPIVSD